MDVSFFETSQFLALNFCNLNTRFKLFFNYTFESIKLCNFHSHENKVIIKKSLLALTLFSLVEKELGRRLRAKWQITSFFERGRLSVLERLHFEWKQYTYPSNTNSCILHLCRRYATSLYHLSSVSGCCCIVPLVWQYLAWWCSTFVPVLIERNVVMFLFLS